MKAIIIAACWLIYSCSSLFAQETQKKSVAVMPLSISGLYLDPTMYTQMLRLYIQKLDTFRVIDRFDQQLALTNTRYENHCYGTKCLMDAGGQLEVDLVIGGSIEKFPNRIIVILTLLDIHNGTQVSQSVLSYMEIPDRVEDMITISANVLLQRHYDELIAKTLMYSEIGVASIVRPYTPALKSNGPRVGYSILTGNTAKVMQMSKRDGGFEAFPGAFVLGYQFEKQYLNEGGFQALVEFIPMISGMEQGLFIPGVTLLQGLRGNRHGWELAFGPQFSIVQKANVFQGPDNHWYLEKDTSKFAGHDHYIEQRVDSRGIYYGQASFVIAIGKTFRSKSLNIPVNIFVVPRKNDMRFGISMGWNSSRKAYK